MSHDSRIDAYLATLPADEHEALQRLRAQIARLVPEAVETISYGMPTLTLNGRDVVRFAAWKRWWSSVSSRATLVDGVWVIK